MIKEEKRVNLTEYKFLELLVSAMCVQGFDRVISKSDLEHKLYHFCSDPKYSFLFEDVFLKQSIDDEYVDLSSAFDLATAWGLLSKIDEVGDTRFLINIINTEVEQIFESHTEQEKSAILEIVEQLKSIGIEVPPQKRLGTL